MPDVIYIVDDCSTVEMPKLSLVHKHTIFSKNGGVKVALLHGCNYLFEIGVDVVITLDSDAIVKPDFVERIVNTHKLQKAITSGFNNPKEPLVSEGYKAHANGINMCFNRNQYEQYIKPALLSDSGNWDYAASKNAGRVAITIPSCVQHIGLKSSMGHKGADIAHDFKRLELPNVTLFGIDSYDPTGIRRAAEISQRDIEFGATKIITDDLFTKGGSTDQRRKDYSRFMIQELSKHFNTSHVLTIHADGYVLNWKAWDSEWLKYDYIGATWWYKDNMNVGNGGFSLRSKKLCDILAAHDLEHYHPEDHHICRTYRPALEKLGVIFAPEEVANQFAIEAYNVQPPNNKYNGAFGFHGPHVDLSMLPEGIRYGETVVPEKKILNSRRR